MPYSMYGKNWKYRNISFQYSSGLTFHWITTDHYSALFLKLTIEFLRLEAKRKKPISYRMHIKNLCVNFMRKCWTWSPRSRLPVQKNILVTNQFYGPPHLQSAFGSVLMIKYLAYNNADPLIRPELSLWRCEIP